MTTYRLMSLVLLLAGAHPAHAQAPAEATAAAEKLWADVIASFNKGDLKTLLTYYTDDYIDIGPDGVPVKGKAAVERANAQAFAGPLKGAKLAGMVEYVRLCDPT